MGTEVPLGAEFKKNGNAIFVTTQPPNRPMDAGEVTTYTPFSSVRHLKQREKSKTQTPVSLTVYYRPLLGDRFGSPDCIEAERVIKQAALNCAEKYFDNEEK